MDDLNIRKIIEEIDSGRLRIPTFQRGFVWDAERVAYLMDSLFKGYPVGALLLWRTKTQLRVERQLGPYRLPDRDPDYPIDYVLDGQQRITSIFGVFQSEIEPQDPEAAQIFSIYFDFRSPDDAQDPQFEALRPDEADPDRYFPLKVLFDPVGYRAATKRFNDNDLLRKLDTMQARFKEVTLPVQAFETDDRARVAIVFERVNRLGVELDTLQLLTAWTWSEDFDLREQVDMLSKDLEPFGFEAIGEDSNLLLRCCAAIIAGDASPAALIGLNGGDVRQRFEEVRNGILGAIDFVRANFHVQALKNLPFSTLLVPLSVFFAVPGNQGVRFRGSQKAQLSKWFWRSCFTRRYSSGVLRSLKVDIGAMKRLKEQPGANNMFDFAVAAGPDFFLENGFSIGSVNTKTFILLLAQQRPLSFISGSAVSLAKVLKDYNRNEFHHLFPQAYLRSKGTAADDIQRLVNVAIVSAQDNKDLGGVAPSKYRKQLPAKQRAEILRRALCPTSLFDDDYERFKVDRAQLLVGAAKVLTQT